MRRCALWIVLIGVFNLMVQFETHGQTSRKAMDRLLILTPSSMSEVTKAIAQSFEQEHGTMVLVSTAGTGQLARQLEAGIPADLMIFADEIWLDWAIDRGLLDPDTRIPIAGNRLVVATKKETGKQGRIPELLTSELFAMGDYRSVPVGRYARQALTKMGLWDSAKGNAVFGENARITLQRLVRGEVSAAIVYASDVNMATETRSVYVVPEAFHSPIVYWVARTSSAVKKNDPKTQTLVEFLKSAKARGVMRDFGFLPPPAPAN